MKKKLVLVLAASMLLGGCGVEFSPQNQSASGNPKTIVQEDPTSSASNATNNEEDPSNSNSQASEEEPALEPAEPLAIPDEVKVPKDKYEKAAYLADYMAKENAGKNTLASPISLEMALGLAAEGASGETLEELKSYLGKENYADWAADYMAFAKELESAKNDRYSFAYEIANSMWFHEGLQLKKEFQNTAEKKFEAKAENVDFINATNEAIKTINTWIEKKTHDMLKDVLKASDITSDTRAVLVNSLYFESPWAEEWGLYEHEFTNLSGEKKTQEMLVDYGLSEYFENDYCTAFAKNYYNRFQFIGILPKEEGDFNISDLDLKGLMESRTTEYDVHAIAPKMDFESEAQGIVQMLLEQGVQKPFFVDTASFDEMIEDDNFFISKIIQKCKIKLDEKGTQAAAVTILEMDEACALMEEREVKEVYLDRPFAFMIYDSRNDEIAFIGKVVE